MRAVWCALSGCHFVAIVASCVPETRLRSGSSSCTRDADCLTGDYCPQSKLCASWSPSLLANDQLVLWLDAGSGVTYNKALLVSHWRDLSTWSNHAQKVDDSNERNPLLIDAAETATIGHAALRFDGENDVLQIPDAARMRWGLEPFIVEVVARYRNKPPMNGQDHRYGAFYVKSSGGDYPYPGAALFGNTQYAHDDCVAPRPPATAIVAQLAACKFSATETEKFNDYAWRVLGMRRVGNTLEVRINGVRAAARELPGRNVDAAGVPAQIGGAISPATQIPLAYQALDGDIAEMVAVRGNDSDADVARLEGYLGSIKE